MSKQAMKLALEALEKCDSALAEELAAWDINPPLHHVLEASNACGPAITAIREALAEQPAQQKPVAFLDWYDNAHWGNEDFKAGCRRAWNAALAQRTWVGLMDEDEGELLAAVIGSLPVAKNLIRAIEAKLREKNT